MSLFPYFNLQTPLTSQSLRDIRPPIDVPGNPLPYILLGMVVLSAILATVWVYYQKRRQNDEHSPIEEIVVNPPHEIAFEQLTKLRDAKCDMEIYHIRISYIIREYIASRFRIPALTMTTTHLLHQLRDKQIGDSYIKRIQQFFLNCDTVKFAKRDPEPSESDARMEEALWFVNETKSTS